MGWRDDCEVLRETWPGSAEHLWMWCLIYAGVRVAREPVCRGHVPPFVPFARQVLGRPRPDLALWHASRGGGKSFLSALDSHLTSRGHPGHETQILGGSLDQSRQIYTGLKRVTVGYRGDPHLGNDAGSIQSLLAQSATYRNGSKVSILACSDKSVRGPHVPSLKLDEVDEIAPDLRESAMGMVMEGETPTPIGSSALLTSTWHRPNGPMSTLMDRAAAGEFPSYTWCVFEVLERCPESRSGPWVGGHAAYANCPRCPIQKACHSDRDEHRGRPKAKRSDGHYRIADLIQKARGVSHATFRSDYACEGPKTEGLFFPGFSIEQNVTELAEYYDHPDYPVHLAVDSGVRTGAVWFQIVPRSDGSLKWDEVRVFADYYREGEEGQGAARAAREILRIGAERCQGRRDVATTDPAGGSRTAIGPAVLAEYRREGLWPLTSWPTYPGSVMDGIALLDSFVKSGDETTALFVHPRCQHLIRAFQSYERAKVAGQWRDYPRDPQHPAEDLIDALRGGLQAKYPEGKRPPPLLGRVQARKAL